MATRHTSWQTLKSIAGAALVAPGLFFCLLTWMGLPRLSQLLGSTPGQGLGVLSSVIFVVSFDDNRLLQGLLQILVSFWPLLFVTVGVVLLRDA